jgi:hypothetical protein
VVAERIYEGKEGIKRERNTGKKKERLPRRNHKVKLKNKE